MDIQNIKTYPWKDWDYDMVINFTEQKLSLVKDGKTSITLTNNTDWTQSFFNGSWELIVDKMIMINFINRVNNKATFETRDWKSWTIDVYTFEVVYN